MEEKEIHGSFYLKQTDSNNLLGEYINNSSSEVMTESAICKSRENGFIGEYLSTWIGNEIQSVQSILKISLQDSNALTGQVMYELRWEIGGQLVYMGKAFQVDNRLVGYYYKLRG